MPFDEKITTESSTFNGEILELGENLAPQAPSDVKLCPVRTSLVMAKLLDIDDDALGEEPLLLEVQGKAIVIVGPQILKEERPINPRIVFLN